MEYHDTNDQEISEVEAMDLIAKWRKGLEGEMFPPHRPDPSFLSTAPVVTVAAKQIDYLALFRNR